MKGFLSIEEADKVLSELLPTFKFRDENIFNITLGTCDFSKLYENDIVEIKYGNEIYKTWTVKPIRPLVTKYLKTLYPESLVIRGIVDVMMFDKKSDEIIPIEIQKTPISDGKFSHHNFEDGIRRQLEGNIINYGKCWLFFDSEYLRFLQSGMIGKSSNINMTWIIDLMREKTLKTFTIRYDGVVKELMIEDFDFIKDISQTCSIKENSDERILNRNKLNIHRNVLIGYNFTQEEITNFENEFDNHYKEKDEESHSIKFFIKSNNERCILYGYISYSLGNLNRINKCLDMDSIDRHDRIFATYLGIFEIIENNIGRRGNRMKFVDKFNICKYFPGYIRQEKHWLTYKGNELDGKTFSNMCRGWYKNSPTLFDY